MTTLLQRVALRELSMMVQSDVDPVLTVDDLMSLLRHAQADDADGNAPDVYESWTASTAYGINELVVPSPRNGYVYRVTTAGTSGSTQPSWPVIDGGTVVNGTVTFTVEDTVDWVPSYDAYWLNLSAVNGWRMKAGKISDLENGSGDGSSLDPQTRRQFMLDQADRFARKLRRSTELTTSRGTACDDTRILAN